MKLFDVYPLYDVTPVSAKDCSVIDEKGQEYLDLYGGHAVISIGHGHPLYVENISKQVSKIGFYSNAVHNPLQKELCDKLGKLSKCEDYQLFLCNSGAEANENALKLASFHTGKSRVIAFKNGFHGRTSAAVAATDNPKINAPINQQQKVTFVPLNDIEAVRQEIEKGDVCSVIIEPIQGVGGLDAGDSDFFKALEKLCKETQTVLILDEVQSGFGRTGEFFGFQHHGIKPDIISMAKGMGNGFPVGGILIADHIKASYGLLGTTFGGNHLACVAVLSVLDVLEKENLIQKAQQNGAYFAQKAKDIKGVQQVKGTGLMIGLDFGKPIAQLRKNLIYNHQIFTGGAKNPNVIRILPPLTVSQKALDQFINALTIEVNSCELV